MGPGQSFERTRTCTDPRETPENLNLKVSNDTETNERETDDPKRVN